MVKGKLPQNHILAVLANWDKKYYLEGSFRRDGYSGLAKDKWGNFGGVSFMEHFKRRLHSHLGLE